MKMPHDMDPLLFAPCGMHCLVCYRYLKPKKPCGGCRFHDAGKPAHCRSCKIKDCVQEKGLAFCYDCDEFPCKPIKSLDKSYASRYGASLVANSKMVQTAGIPVFLDKQRVTFTCRICGGVISLHDRTCSECDTKA